MDIKMFLSPVVGRRSLSGSPAVGRRRNGHFRREDESHLLQSPTDCEANEITNGNCASLDDNNSNNSTTTAHISSFTTASSTSNNPPPEVGFCLPNKIKTPVSQVCLCVFVYQNATFLLNKIISI